MRPLPVLARAVAARALAAAAAAALVAALLPAVPLAAQPEGPGPAVEVHVDRPRPASDDLVRLTYVFSGSTAGGNLRAPAQLPLKNLRVVGGPNTSTQISFINGEVSRTSSLTYFLKPLGPGPAEVGETAWKVGDFDVKAPAYALEVGPPRRGAGTAAAGPGGGDAGADDDPFEAFFGRRSPSRPAAPRADPLVLYTATADKLSAYVGEEVVIHYELVTQADVQGIEYVEPPKFPGVWAEDLERPDRPTGRSDTIGGHPVARFTLLKKVISGLAPGTVTIPPARIRIGVRTAFDPFGDPFGGLRPQVLERETKPITIRILPIPGHPDFKGPVGRFDVTASLDRSAVPVGEAVTLRLKVSGQGNLRTAGEAPPLSLAGVRVYPPQAKSSPTRSGPKATASVEWDYVLVPSRPGPLEIPPVPLEVFDPALRKVVTRASAPLHVSVEGDAAAAAAAAAAAPTAPAATAATAATVAEAVTVPASETAGSAPARAGRRAAADPPPPAVSLATRTVSIPLWLLVTIPAALLAAGGATLALRGRMRSRGAARARLAAEPGETKERAAARIEEALRQAIARRCGLAETAPEAELLAALERAGLPAPLRKEAKEVLDEAEFLRFAPQLGDYEAEIARARERAVALLARLS